MFHKGKHSGTPSFLKRDRAFKAALAKQYGVEKTPKHLQMVLEETYRKLPDTVPVPYRPVRRILRQTATVFAVLVLTFAALWGVNGTYPQLTEALPGLGLVFQAINGGRHPTPNPDLTPSPDLDPAPAPTATPKPTFQPVTMLKDAYSGNMFITNAWSDGGKLYLDLELDLVGDLWDLMQTKPDWDTMDPDRIDYLKGLSEFDYLYTIRLGNWWISESGFPEIDDNSSIFVNGLDLSHQWSFDFSEYDGGKSIHAQSVVYLRSDIEVDKELQVELLIPDFYVCERWNPDQEVAATFSPGFQTDFTVPVDRSKAFSLDHSVQQNGVTLEALDFTPSYISVNAELPYLGKISETLLPLDPIQGWGEALLGLYPQLTDCSGTPVIYYDIGAELLSDLPQSLEPGAPMKFHFLFQSENNPQNVQGPLRLTFYELPFQNETAVEVDKLALRRVVAEFTIELDTNQVIPTEHFRQEGREQVDITRDPATLADSGFINSFRVLSEIFTHFEQYSSPSGSSEYFELISRWDGESWPLVFKGYLKDKVAQEFFVTLRGGDIQDEAGDYYEGIYTAPSTGEEYWRISLFLHLPAWVVDEKGNPIPFDRVELLDGETGMTLIPDLMEAMKQSYRLEPSSTTPTSLFDRRTAAPTPPPQSDKHEPESESSFPEPSESDGSSSSPEDAQWDTPTQIGDGHEEPFG